MHFPVSNRIMHIEIRANLTIKCNRLKTNMVSTVMKGKLPTVVRIVIEWIYSDPKQTISSLALRD